MKPMTKVVSARRPTPEWSLHCEGQKRRERPQEPGDPVGLRRATQGVADVDEGSGGTQGGTEIDEVDVDHVGAVCFSATGPPPPGRRFIGIGADIFSAGRTGGDMHAATVRGVDRHSWLSCSPSPSSAD